MITNVFRYPVIAITLIAACAVVAAQQPPPQQPPAPPQQMVDLSDQRRSRHPSGLTVPDLLVVEQIGKPWSGEDDLRSALERSDFRASSA
jgi:hypothetical protein